MNLTQAALVAINAFVALTAIGGGLALILGLENRRFSTDILRRTPFRDFTIPGYILLVVVGGSAATAAVVTIAAGAVGGAVSAAAGVILVGYIAVEGAILEQPQRYTATEVVYFVLGLAMVLLGVIVWRT